jgi:hypothetical protein
MRRSDPFLVIPNYICISIKFDPVYNECCQQNISTLHEAKIHFYKNKIVKCYSVESIDAFGKMNYKMK